MTSKFQEQREAAAQYITTARWVDEQSQMADLTSRYDAIFTDHQTPDGATYYKVDMLGVSRTAWPSFNAAVNNWVTFVNQGGNGNGYQI